MEIPEMPRGGIDTRKYAALALALGMARGALYSALDGDTKRLREILDLTATMNIAKALGCDEIDLAIDWDQHLSHEESERIKGY